MKTKMTSLDVQDSLQERVLMWKDQFPKDQPGFCEPCHAYWKVDLAFALTKLGDATEWIRFFDAEVSMWAAEGDPGRFDNMLDAPITEPVVVLQRSGKHYVWDGNHRIGASFKRGLTSIPAIVGVPFNAGGHYLRALDDGQAKVEPFNASFAKLYMRRPEIDPAKIVDPFNRFFAEGCPEFNPAILVERNLVTGFLPATA
ncbi:hypothetical protein [Paraburkholderia sp. SIMBA_054]|uniref:hypothetical protein n=1 Tax=Paraburkholderia sp. SIMBA_054 TaxID=3085795 RepID=UPI00397BEE93